MAKGRMLNWSVTESMKFHRLPDDTCRLMATWTISLLDAYGVFHADPVLVKSRVFPMRADVSVEQVQKYLDAMEAAGLMRRFERDGRIYQYWPGFKDNQPRLHQEREGKSAFPPPPNCPKADGALPEEVIVPSIDVAELVQSESGNSPPQSNIREANTSEVNLRESTPAPADDIPVPSAFKNQTAPPRKPRAPKFSPVNITTSEDPRVRSYLEIIRDEITTTNAATICERVTDNAVWRDVLVLWAQSGWRPTNFTGMFERYEATVNASRITAQYGKPKPQVHSNGNGKRDTFRRQQVIYTDAERKAAEQRAKENRAKRLAERARAQEATA